MSVIWHQKASCLPISPHQSHQCSISEKVFEEIMCRLNKTMLTENDGWYSVSEQEIREQITRLEREYYLTGFEDGRKQGKREWQTKKREEGREQGKEEQKIDIVKRMAQKGKSPEEIADLTELSIECIQRIVRTL